MNYTFSQRFGWGRLRTKVSSFLVALLFPRLIRSAGGIPVFRRSHRLRGTFRESVAALMRGESLLIFPDVDYTSTQADTGKLYEGFFMLDLMLYKKTGRHVPFVPIHISDQRRLLVSGKPLMFTDERSYGEEREKMTEALVKEMNRMSLEFGE